MTTGRSDKPARFEALDSLRGVCACAVVIHHMHSVGHLTNLTFFRQSWLFVDFFFVLSGFVIASAYNQRLTLGFPVREFVTLRLGRIYPLHLFMLTVFVGLELGGMLVGSTALNRGSFEGSRSLPALVSNVLLVQIFGFHPIETWNSPSWSIAAEFWTYIIFAVAVAKTPARWQGAVFVSMLFFSLALLMTTGAGGLSRTYTWSLARCVYGFAIGVLVNYAWVRHSQRPQMVSNWLIHHLAEIGVTAVAIALLCVPLTPSVQLLIPPLFGGLIFILAQEQGPISAILKSSPLKMIGLLSYSIYMVHLFVIGRTLDALSFISRRLGYPLTTVLQQDGVPWKAFAGSPGLSDAMVLSCVVITALAAWFTFRWIEKPSRLASRKLAERIGGRQALQSEKIASAM